jgi:hypothetical protein
VLVAAPATLKTLLILGHRKTLFLQKIVVSFQRIIFRLFGKLNFWETTLFKAKERKYSLVVNPTLDGG